MPLTVRELTQIPYLRTRLFAGKSGADRPVAWAHSIELPEPWIWIEAGDLLMTVGLGVPADPDQQVAYVENLAAAGASGIAIGEHMNAPPLAPVMLAAADRAALPLLFTAYEVPFVQVSRAVAAANQDREHVRLVQAARIYDRVRMALANASTPGELLQALGEEIRCSLSVCGNEDGFPLFSGTNVISDSARVALVDAVQSHAGAMPGMLRLDVGKSVVLVLPIPSGRHASLIAVPRGTDVPPYAILQHVATVVALEAERQWAAREELRRLGSETLAQLMDARISPASAAPQLRIHGLERGPFVLLAAGDAGGEESQGSGPLHHLLAERAIPHMLLRQGEILYCLLPATDTLVDEATASIKGDIGISDPFSESDTVPSAAREARWALAQTNKQRVTRYGDGWSILGPRSVSEARELVKEVLGPIISYDQEHGTSLLASLDAFLTCNRSWLVASAQLSVHKQTLVYRMRRIEELTGRRLNDTSSVSELWLAMRARTLIGR